MRNKAALLTVIQVFLLAAMATPALAQDVIIQNYAFIPNAMNINLGDTVTWTNLDPVTHTVTSDTGSELDSGDIVTNMTYSHTFNTPGAYNYHSNYYINTTRGTIYVAGPTPPSYPSCQDVQCGVEVTGLDVSGNNINYSIKNAGNSPMSISYVLSVNGGSIDYAVPLLASCSTNSYQKQYAFGTGRHEISLYAHADCGANHSATIVHWVFEQYTCNNPQGTETQNRCDYASGQYLTCANGQWTALGNRSDYCNNCPHHCGDGICSCAETHSSCPSDCASSCQQGYAENYSCNGNILQRGYIYSNCTMDWVPQTLCVNGCYDGACINQTTPNCGVQITSFDYLNHVVEGSYGYITVSAKNSGDATTRINTSLWIDGILKDYKYQNVQPSAELQSTFSYLAADDRQHSVLVKSNAGCGSEDSRTSSITNIPYSSQPSAPPYYPMVPAAKVTAVSFYPSSIDAVPFRVRIIGVSMVSSKPQTFMISASGPAEWLDYAGSVEVEDEKTAYVYITPQETGSYNISISVKAAAENLTFSTSIPLFVAAASEATPESLLGGLWDDAKAWAAYLIERPMLLVAAMLLALVIVLLIGHRRLKREKWPIVGGE